MQTISSPNSHFVSQPITRQRTRHFTPNWFAATMGTGILSICLAQFPTLPLLWQAGRLLWMVNILLFASLSVLYARKWLLHRREAWNGLEHPVVSMFAGCIPMGFATIVNGTIIYGLPHMGAAGVPVATSLWWIDAGIALLSGFGIPFLMFTRQDHKLEQMNATWLLPIVACEVTAASGGLLLPHIDGATAQMTVLFASYVLWAFSVPLALSIITILFLRLALHKLPPAGMAATAFLALGPTGTGALGLLLFAANGRDVLDANGLGPLAGAICGAAFLGAILLWAYGLWWLGMGIAMTARYIRRGLPFNLGWWGYTFPIGVFALATLRLSAQIPVPAIGLFGDLLVAGLAAIWLVVGIRTCRGAIDGTLFHDPSLEA
ncbi:TDT family transporter [Rhizobium sp. S152]|uniref:TDT family transporter n=1 Tax=Rhizobium sp. S152 TaxID=3055038 RepID=UPI0025A99561|nr:TDT family transporter [Rhizobium sp. S152]MDM9625962.1 TDT family transporter [Rhizobium sp. S152]